MSDDDCRPDGFISRRRAKRAAWLHSDGTDKDVTPIYCPACERYHLTASPTTETNGD